MSSASSSGSCRRIASWEIQACSSRFTGGPAPYPSTRRDGVLHRLTHAKAQDIVCSVDIGIFREAALDTLEGRLALAALWIDGATRRTCLRGVGGLDVHNRPAALFELVREQARECVPSLVEDGSIETRLLADHLPWLLQCSSGRLGHVPNVEVFHRDRAEALSDVYGRSMQPVAADASAPRAEPGAELLMLAPPVRAALFAPQRALGAPVSALNGYKARRNGHLLPGAERQRVGDTTIYPNRRREALWSLVLYLAGEDSAPARRPGNKRHVLDVPPNGARVTKLDPADLWEPKGRPLGIQAPDTHVGPPYPNRLASAFDARFGVFGAPAEESPEGEVQVAKRIFQRSSRNIGNPVHLRAKVCDLAALGHGGNDAAGLSPILSPKVATLLKAEIVHKPHRTRPRTKTRRLRGRGLQVVAKASVDHRQSLTQMKNGNTHE